MTFRNDTYTGGYHYWIGFSRGCSEVRRETYGDGFEVVFIGHYADCVGFLRDLIERNVEIDLGL